MSAEQHGRSGLSDLTDRYTPDEAVRRSAPGPDADRIRREVFANLSHALRTPLHQVCGLVHLLEVARAEGDGPRFGTFLGFLDTSCRQLRHRLEAMLEHARACATAPRPAVDPVDVGVMLDELVGRRRPDAQRRRLTLVIDHGPDTGLVADPQRLRLALDTLLDNALAYTPDGGHITVRVRAADPGQVRFEVEDDGIGIEAPDLQSLFVEFARLPAGEARNPDGLGLGLALCRRLVESMGGSVDVRSRLGLGSVFALSLPRSPAVVQPGPSIADGSTQRS